jgi:tRNA-dependent cyclodipeptide synthase
MYTDNMIDYQIIDAVDSSIYWKDLSGKYLGCNKYMTTMIGKSRDEIIGSTDYLLPRKDQANAIREIDLLVVSKREQYEIEETVTIKDGTTKVFLSIKNPLFDKNNEVIGVIGVSIDITHHKRFEHEFEKTENALDQHLNIKNRFIQNINHESRIPLGSMLSISELLVENWSKFDDKTKFDNTKLIFKEASRLSKFVLDTFDTSNFLQNGVDLNFKNSNFSEFLKEVIEKYTKYYSDTKVSIEMDSLDNFSFSFDPILITRVIENLMMNAIQYSPKKKNITIRLFKTYLKNTEIPAIHCCIIDEGIGIPEKELESVFNPFTESSRTASKACGVGLGLSICKEFIEAHSGFIWVENNVLKSGVTFNFTIPTNLLSLSNNLDLPSTENKEKEHRNIILGDLKKNLFCSKKEPFALIGISPFNSYFSVEKILELCEWIYRRYDNFAIFIPDEISKYTFEALGYTKERLNRKTKKQDNYTMNKVTKALSMFYDNHEIEKDIEIHTISKLKEDKSYKDLYLIFSQMFFNNKIFRHNCLDVTHWILSNNNNKNIEIDDFQKNIAVQYFLFELPIMTYATDVLKLGSCDFVYHNIPAFLKHLYINKELVSLKQRLLILK